MTTRKILVVTGSRAEYGLLHGLMREIKNDSRLQLQVVVTGSHLSEAYGLTYKEIEDDGFVIDAKIDLNLQKDTDLEITKAMGKALLGCADVLQNLKPDIVVIYGDRYEILACAEAAMMARIPLAHIGGGDVTEGVYDDSIRHCLTKMSHFHFVTNSMAAKRVRQLGENPKQIYLVGSAAIDQMKRTQYLDREELAQDLKFDFKKTNLLVTFHPETLAATSSEQQMQELLAALESLGNQVGIVFTKPNADKGSLAVIRMIDEFIGRNTHARAYSSLGQKRYWSLIRQVDVVIGNSSSGVYEVPSFKKPSVNIGNRQKGRLCAESVVPSHGDRAAILTAIQQALALDCSKVKNPYERENTAALIKNALRDAQNPERLVQKKFYDLEIQDEDLHNS